MFYLWRSRCHRQNSDSQRSVAGRRLLLEESILLHISEEEILAGSRWEACREILKLFFPFFSFLRLCGWRKKCMYSITSGGKHASPSQRCVYSPATSWPEESFSAYWAARLQEIVLEAWTFWTALSTSMQIYVGACNSWHFERDVIECVVQTSSLNGGDGWGVWLWVARWRVRDSHWNKFCLFRGRNKGSGAETG